MDGRSISILILIVILIGVIITGTSIIIKYRGDISDLQDNQSTLQQELADTTAQLDSSSKEFQVKKEQLAQLTLQLSKLTDQNLILTNTATDIEKRLDHKIADFESLQNTYFALNDQYELLKISYDDALEDLNHLNNVYPLRDFASYSDLNSWVVSHLQSITNDPSSQFKAALHLVELGMERGYWIGIDIEFDSIQHLYSIYCNAVAGHQLYRFAPDLPNLIATGFYR